MILPMKEISIQDLEARLSGTVAEAEAGETIVITRHHDPVARLGPAGPSHVYRGRAVGTSRLRPAIRRGTKGRYLAVINDDRGNR